MLAKPIRRFRNGMRVYVHAAIGERGEAKQLVPPRLGSVCRVRMSDEGAWVRLDERVAEPIGVHPFEPDDGRGRNVLAYPESCTVASQAMPQASVDETTSNAKKGT